MYIEKVKLNGYRNYDGANVAFSPALNVIRGANAVGKTNLIESVYFAGLGKSPRLSQDKDLIMWGKDQSYIAIDVVKKYRKHTLEFHLDSKGKKRIAIDKIPLLKMSELIGFINIVYFSPDEIRLIKESPQERRRFMDISLTQQKKTYLYALSRYNKILLQRNKLLKTMRDITALKSTLPVWDIQLAKEGAIVISERYAFVEKLKKIAARKHFLLTLGKETLEMEYETGVENASLGEMSDALLNTYTAAYDKDILLQHTSVGPHRDDLKLIVDGIDIRKFGSQGQQRTTALSLKLAEIEGFRNETGENPVLLLDDVLSELDETRQKQLLKATEGIQTMLTCTEFNLSADGLKPNFIDIPLEK